MTEYVGKAPLTIVKRTNRTQQYVYVDEAYPKDPAPGELERHLQRGFISQLEPIELLVVPVDLDDTSAPVDPDTGDRVELIDGPGARPKLPRVK